MHINYCKKFVNWIYNVIKLPFSDTLANNKNKMSNCFAISAFCLSTVTSLTLHILTCIIETYIQRTYTKTL